MYMMMYVGSALFGCYDEKNNLYQFSRNQELYTTYKKDDVLIRFLWGSNYGEYATLEELKKDYCLLKRRASAGDVYAQLAIGISEGQVHYNYTLMDGTEIYRNRNEAIRYLKMAEEQGGFCANKIIMYLYNAEIDDCEEKVEFYKKMSLSNDTDAMYRLGYMYFEGRCVNKDESKAIYYFEKAYNNGYHDNGMINDIARYYSNEGNGDNEKALEWWHIGAKYNYELSLSNLGWSYRYGHGVQIDYQKALDYYKRASECEYGNGYAERNIGEMYLNGNGVPVNRDMARQWYEKAAKRGDGTAQEWLKENT